MLYSQYLRIESIAGGVTCSDRDFIRACRSRLLKRGKLRANRDARQKWIREGLDYLASSRYEYHAIVRGLNQ